MAYKDMREWIARLEAEGELKRITAGVDWNLELGQITRKAIKEHAPALLFENIKDHENTRGRKLLANSLATRKRMALAIGLPADTSSQEITRVLRQRFKEAVKPVRVKTGPVKENIMKGKDVDLLQFPVPKWHPLDGGRYINTMCGIITRDPDTGELNIGLYRGMVNGKNKINVLLVPSQHWGQHFMKYQERKQPMPVAVAYGWDDVLPIVAGTTFAHPPSEYEIMGALRETPVELVRCETSDLEVPATAEIVVEGTISTDPDSYEMEGPYGEWPGYYGWSRKRPVIKVDCITHRNDPIFRGQVTGQKVGGISEAGIMAFHAYGAVVWNYLETAGIPGILDVVSLPTTTVKIHKIYEGQARQIAAAIWGSWFAPQYAKNVIVVDDDVDIRSLRDVELAIRNRVDPKDQVIIYPGSIGCNLDPSIVLEERDELLYGGGIQNRMLIDATIDWCKFPVRKEYGNQRFPPKCGEATPEIIKLVDERWREYGF
ncbi:UbiD family decarboxylase [Chloroflexota bacterium]